MLETTYYDCPFGLLEIKGSELGLHSVKKVEKAMYDYYDPPKSLKPVVKQLDEYFNKKRKDFKLKLDWGGNSDFYKSVWNELIQIPYGHTTSYLKIAEKIGNPKAVRAVGMANRNNPIAIIVPCHRVIASNGKLQGYFYGLDIKRQLLELENPDSFAEQGSLF